VLRFFFQAEDGIRDFHVTGVQTCALPISPPSSPAPQKNNSSNVRITPSSGPHSQGRPPAADFQNPTPHPSAPPASEAQSPDFARSEERRVGKESRLWWSGDR